MTGKILKQLMLLLVSTGLFFSAQAAEVDNTPVEVPANMPQLPLPPLPALNPGAQAKSQESKKDMAATAEDINALIEQMKALEAQSQAAQGAQAQSDAPANTANQKPTSTYGTVYDPAFQNLIKKKFPMTPAQIKALREVFQTTQRASVAPIEVPTPTVSTRNVLLAPGSVPPVIKMATGYVSSVVFLDETGQPWPVTSYSIGNPDAFNVQWDKVGNIMMIQGKGAYDTGNIAVRLSGLETPVMLTMINDQQKVDYRVDLRVQGRGPNARSPIIGSSLPQSANSALIDLLDGVPPMGSQKLVIKGGAAEAWSQGNTMFLRTRLTILSPSWTATMQSADGMRVYELHTTPMILASVGGKTIQLRVEGL